MTTAEPDPSKCPHCGGYHETTCQRIRAIEYYENGMVKRVEFHGASPSPTLHLSADDLWDLRNPLR